MQSLSRSPTPFINIDPTLPIEDHIHTTFHNLRNLGRTNRLYHLIAPSRDSLTLQIETFWAAFIKKTFTSVEQAIHYISQKMDNIHPELAKLYKEQLTAKTEDLEKIASPIARKNAQDLLLQEVSAEKIKKLGEAYFRKASSDASAAIRNTPKNAPTKGQLLSQLKTIWEQAQTKADLPFSQRRFLLVEALKSLPFPGLQNLYIKDLALIRNSQELDQRLSSYLTDLRSVQSYCMPAGLRSVPSGLMGYGKIIDLSRANEISGFMKYLNPDDMDSYLAYSSILDLLQISGEKKSSSLFTITIPACEMFDPTTLLYTDMQGRQKQVLDHDLSYLENDIGYIQSLTESIAKSNPCKIKAYTGNSPVQNIEVFLDKIQKNPLGFFEKAKGDDFPSFLVSESYHLLPFEDKLSLFKTLGKIAFLDFLIGNQDRLIRLNYKEPKFEKDLCDVQDSNLSNLKISLESFTIHLLDNGIGGGESPLQESLDRETLQSNYTEFLRSTFQDPAALPKLANYLYSSLKTAYSYMECDDEEEDLDQAASLSYRTELETEFNDNQEQFTNALQEGIQEMKQDLINHVLPHLSGPTNFVKNLQPMLLETLHTRLTFLQQPL